ncbi:MAG: glycosyltransferase [Phycisphaerae bacterium]|nr:glycosyltransferase [Saprospiraceae bacterium]
MMIFFAFICLLLTVQLVYPFVTVLLVQLFRRESHGLKTAHHSPTTTHHSPLTTHQSTNHHFACIITAYRNVAIARPLVESLLRQTHPNLTIYLVADECPEFDFDISDKRFVALRPPEPLRLKAKSLLYAIDNFCGPHDFVAVFDADNLAHPQFLAEINRFANGGFRCIQGQRLAKNLDTTYAALDSMGEHYKNYIEREVPYRLGGSAVISGSGMATEVALYKAYLGSPDINLGKHQWKKMLQEDKILQNFLLRRGERIAYARQAIVYDEKVETGEAVETQRSRWLFSYFQNMPNALGILRRGFFGLNFNQLYFGFVTLVLPMFIQLGLAIVFVVLAFFIAPVWSVVLMAAIIIFSLNILWSLRLDDAAPEVLRAVWQVPKFVLRQFRGLFKMRSPNKYFKHTEHRKVVSVDELAERRPEFERED